MDEKLKPFEPLLEQIEIYGKTSIEVFRLKSLNSISSLGSVMVTRLLLSIFLLLFLVTLSIATSIYLGEYYGSLYLGFLLVSAFYFVISLLVILLMPFIGSKCKNYLIRILLKY